MLRRCLFLYGKIGNQVSLTNSTLDIIKRKQKALKNTSTFLRLDIEAGQGCQGYRYKFSYDSQVKDTDRVIEDGESKGVLFATDEQNIKLLNGCVVDHENKMMRSSFYVKDNPMAEVSCSCKTSFSPKESAFK